MVDMKIPGGWPFKGPVLQFMEYLCEELLRWDVQGQAAKCMWMAKVIREKTPLTEFVARQVPDEESPRQLALLPTRP